MGLLKHLLFWPVTGPRFLTKFSLEKVEGAVKTELTDDSAVKRELMELQMQLELGDIDEEEYIAREAALMARLRDVRQWKERFGMPTSGGLVRVAEDAHAPPAQGGAPSDAPEAGTPEPTPEPAPEPDDDRQPSVASSEEAEIDVVFGFDDED